MTIIKDGTGSGYNVAVDQTNKIQTRTVSASITEEGTVNGDSFNINSGLITLTSSNASGLLYYKHNEDRPFHIDALAIGIDNLGTNTTQTIITMIRNPTTGTLISTAAAVDMNQNRNFGSSKTLVDSLAYKGAEGHTVTDGDDIAMFFQSAGGRLFATIDFIMTKGDSLAITMDPQVSSGTTTVYCAIIGHMEAEI